MADRDVKVRTTILILVLFFVFGGFLFKLYSIQILNNERYVSAAKDQSTQKTTTQAQRGSILAKDRDGKIYTLAASEEQYSLSVVPEQVRNKENLARLLADEDIGLDYEEILILIDNDKPYIPPLVHGLTPEKADSILKNNFVGVFVSPEFVRVYPEGSAIAPQLLGFVGSDGQGKYGIEATKDLLLRGLSGAQEAKRDSLGRLIDILGADQSTPGADVLLTIDYSLQFTVEAKLKEATERFKAEGGSVVVVNPETGAVLAMASYPTFDPNNFNKVRPKDQGVFVSGATSQYEPGSVMKPITMAMAIDLGLVEPETTEVFGGSVEVGGYQIRNAESKTYGRETMTQVLENSDNVAMVWLSKKIGIKPQRELLDKFGFGKKTNIELVGEHAGILQRVEDWNQTKAATAAYGQGISATALQMASAYSVIANDGKLIMPHLVDQIIRPDGSEKPAFTEPVQVISKETAKKVREMLVSVVVNGHGKRAAVEGVKVGGKTGTAEVADPSGGYSEDRHIGSFAGMFPAEDPKFVMVVRLDNPKTVRFAESSAAPVFGELANWITNYYQIR